MNKKSRKFLINLINEKRNNTNSKCKIKSLLSEFTPSHHKPHNKSQDQHIQEAREYVKSNKKDKNTKHYIKYLLRHCIIETEDYMEIIREIEREIRKNREEGK